MTVPRFGLATLMLVVLSIGLAMALVVQVRREDRLAQQLAAVQAENDALKKRLVLLIQRMRTGGLLGVGETPAKPARPD